LLLLPLHANDAKTFNPSVAKVKIKIKKDVDNIEVMVRTTYASARSKLSLTTAVTPLIISKLSVDNVNIL